MTPSLPERAADTTADQPWPLRLLSMKVGDYIDKMSVVWVEGQVVQLNRRPGSSMAFLTLRDADVDMSFSVAIRVTALDAMPPLQQGARVVTQVKPVFWAQRGSLTLDARQIRPVGVGELLARIEYLKTTLASEGLFDASRKRTLPFLPRTVGLICGRGSAAERDVVENARRRWPAVRFDIRTVAVQGANAVPEVVTALQALDGTEEVDVIVIARGGGSVEDLLPFSNEALLRAVSAARTPVVSAIGHDVDTPLLDHVADLRASTPTDAAKAVVPDVRLEVATITASRGRMQAALGGRLRHERAGLAAIRSRPVLTAPGAYLSLQRDELTAGWARARSSLTRRLERERDRIEHLRRTARVLSPESTIERGYALVTTADGEVVTSPDQVGGGDLLRVRVAAGDFAATVADADDTRR
ncbi:exodeoxyribonuclease VII large subunit [Nostocoides sp. F2B08]|uniref:exodeoxyribonuclease VII large subunit n=1 Tax=Nostocoides sp. F2B08 TaxID=2653936 RepID=UPI00126328DE|nr:exodeoxyribonuclease VII large subunit [Tetrasphaera sp. F2B08]KAB7746290.1 exodeoxyribonuclease VII large subunit [Tetrasphaera sp. F2B08]